MRLWQGFLQGKRLRSLRSRSRLLQLTSRYLTLLSTNRIGNTNSSLLLLSSLRAWLTRAGRGPRITA